MMSELGDKREAIGDSLLRIVLAAFFCPFLPPQLYGPTPGNAFSVQFFSMYRYLDRSRHGLVHWLPHGQDDHKRWLPSS